MSDSSGKKRPSINLSLFINLSESFSSDHGSKSPNSSIDFKVPTKSPRNFESGVVGLGIVAAMNETNDTHEPFSSVKTSRAAKIAVSPRSQPIPILSAKPIANFRGPVLEKDEIELSESYTCVISHLGNDKIKKREYFDKPDGIDDNNNWGNCGVFFASPPNHVAAPPKYVEALPMPMEFQAADFLNSCYLCRKKLHGLDIFMYRGDKAFCSVECRCKQILCDERKEKCGSETRKPFDHSVSPCSAPRFFTAGVAAA